MKHSVLPPAQSADPLVAAELLVTSPDLPPAPPARPNRAGKCGVTLVPVVHNGQACEVRQPAQMPTVPAAE